MQDIFFAPKEQYSTPLAPVKNYLEQLTLYIQKKMGWDFDRSKAKAVEIVKSRFNDRAVKCFERVENGDRVVKNTTLLSYIKENLAEGNVLAPTFTTYMPAKKKKSVLSLFMTVSKKKRSIAKKESHRAKAAGDLLLADNKNNEQNNLKTYANSMSGSFAQLACILHNPSNHSTLTSITRTMTSMSNASNERVIAGNRYYPRPIDVLNNIVYIVANTNEEKIRAAINAFGVHIPTVQETVAVLRRSSDLYFWDRSYYERKIIPFLETLSGEQLASICYSGDFYHLRKFNSELVRTMLQAMSRKVLTTERDPNIADKLYALDETMVNFVHHIFYEELKGKGKDYREMLDTGIPDCIYATYQSSTKVLHDYKLFFNAFFMNTILPNNSFRLKNMVRRTVVLSDTDSTCFTLDEWVKWYKGGEFWLDSETIAMGGAVAYITTQVIVNFLRILSRNLNIDESQLDSLGMKNEFLWLAHAPAEVSKHYYAYTVLQEGTVLTKPEIEIKGVHLKNSTVPKFVIEDARALMTSILEKTSRNEKLNFTNIVRGVIGLEASVRASVYKGEPVFLKRSKINTAESYSQTPQRSPYGRHKFWNEVFGPTYGEFPEPPYGVVKIPTTITTKTALKAWVESIGNPELRARLAAWLVANNKSNLPTIYLNDGYVTSNGIPPDIMRVIDIQRIILDVTIQHRVIIETLGVVLYKSLLIGQQFSPDGPEDAEQTQTLEAI